MTHDRVSYILQSIPAEHQPEYFSRSEFVQKIDERRIDNVVALEEFLRSEWSYYFHGKDYFIEIWAGEIGPHCLMLYSSNVMLHVHFIQAWIRNWGSMPVRYGYFCSPDELEHRNGFSIRFSNTGTGGIKGLIGRDHRRYLPGLYWLNLFSMDYLHKQQLDPHSIASATEAQMSTEAWGCSLVLYHQPQDWTTKMKVVDDYLFITPNCFSKNRVNLPDAVRTDEHLAILRSMHDQWP